MRSTSLILFAFSCFLLPSLRAETLDEVLARMDAAAKNFQSFSAKIKWTDYTAVIDDLSERSGTVRAHKSKAGVSGLMEFIGTDATTQRFGGKTFEMYYPKANTVDIIDVGKRAGEAEQFILLGFAVSSGDIRKSYDGKVAGSDVLGGVRTTRLELIPKGAETKKLVSKIELWIPEGQGNPVQEKITKSSKNYSLIGYSDLKINPSLPDDAFELKLPANVHKNYPQK